MNQWISVPLYRADADSAHSLDGGSYYLGVSPGYFALTGTRLVDGRRFLSSDRAGAPPVIVIGETMARQIWPGQRAVGQCLRPVAPSHPCYTVVGVAVDVHEFRIQENTSEWQYYYPLDQLPLRGSDRTLVIRARKEQAEAVAASTQALLRATFPGATSRAITMNQALQGELLPWKLGLKLFGALALFALIVASVGVYGVVSFDVRQRTREIGVRMALGAAGGHVIRMLVRRSTVVVAIGTFAVSCTAWRRAIRCRSSSHRRSYFWSPPPPPRSPLGAHSASIPRSYCATSDAPTHFPRFFQRLQRG
jgi:hypothetical protein